ncbi:MAG: His/Gly/Thr/Pro-type tRNA ligase C-terminal domain-containing protein, partial [Actinomycetota bacterium]|nr:His/Gly/Thr/Pro-type tRNA ligase C-terminal domain-containing protein [Actinomycetota bacterium]
PSPPSVPFPAMSLWTLTGGPEAPPDPDDPEAVTLANEAETAFTHAGLDVLVDDRAARPGVKFADAELIGVPYRLTVGGRSLGKGQVEFTPRQTGTTEMLDQATYVEAVLEAVLTS